MSLSLKVTLAISLTMFHSWCFGVLLIGDNAGNSKLCDNDKTQKCSSWGCPRGENGKFYYQLLHHWIQDFNEYNIYCDVKKNRDPLRLHTLKNYLDASNISSTIKNIQSLPSRELVLIQFCDFLLGAASSRMNNMLRVGSAKEAVVQYLEKSLGVEKLIKTVRDEQKFNVFKIRLKGGW